jgi:nitrogen PTS system EIIA component
MTGLSLVNPMPDETFDLASLASYLHMMPAQVSRLAERGKLPGRRVAGQWVFSRPEISHWLEDRMGLSDDEELAAIESNLRRQDQSAAADADFAALLSAETIAIPLAARTRGSVISEMCELAAATGMLWDVQKMADAVAQREAMAPTALDNGVAVLHPRRPLSSVLGQAVLALGITSQGIPFGGAGLTDIFFLIAATSDHEYLRILARLSRIINDADWLAELRTAEDAATARRLILERDASISI